MPSPGAGEVLVRIHAVGINPVDWKVREGLLAKAAPRALPFILGQDFTGKVINLGEDVAGVEASDTVYGFANGAYTEYAVVSPSMIASKPRTVHDTTRRGLADTRADRAADRPRRDPAPAGSDDPDPRRRRRRQLDRDPAVPVQGARVVATAASSNAAYLNGLGVAQVIDYHTERFEDRMKGVDAVIDLVGGDTLVRSFAVLILSGAWRNVHLGPTTCDGPARPGHPAGGGRARRRELLAGPPVRHGGEMPSERDASGRDHPGAARSEAAGPPAASGHGPQGGDAAPDVRALRSVGARRRRQARQRVARRAGGQGDRVEGVTAVAVATRTRPPAARAARSGRSCAVPCSDARSRNARYAIPAPATTRQRPALPATRSLARSRSARMRQV